MKRILIAEDEPDIQELLCAYLREAGYEPHAAGDGVAALSMFEEMSFDLVLLDLMLPKIDGFGVCELIRRKSQVPILMVTALDGEAEQLRGFGMDIDDYVTKPFSMPVLLEKIRVILRRSGGAGTGNRLHYRDVDMDLDTREAIAGGKPLDLTAREFELLYTFLSEPGRVFTREMLLSRLWGYDFFGDERVVDSHMKNLRRKLGRDYIETVRGLATVLRKKIRESLTIRIFLITAVILFSASAVTFGLIAWVTPVTYTAVMSSDLMRQTENLVKQLKEVTLEESGAVIDSFIRSAGADAAVTDRYGMPVDTGSSLSVVPVYEEESGTEIAAVIAEAPGGSGADGTVSVTMSEQSVVMADVQFAGSEERYVLHVTPRVQAENMAVRALIKMAPWLFVLLLFLSVVCAFVYSRYITRPIVRLSHIAGRLAELDFQWECGEKRQDEIGKLGRSLDQMARRLSGALKKLENANRILRGEVERERELDRQRMAFFSAASHELKTPVTILKGQLSGMLEGVDIYKDRDKYLLRSLQVTGRMEKLIEEMLSIARMEAGAETVKKEPVELSRILEKQAALYSELAVQREQVFKTSLTPGIFVSGDAALLEKAFGNLLSNASLYSPAGAKIRLWCGRLEGVPAVTVENTGACIGEAALPHLFEAFYREEASRSRSTGGSGLGLYLVRMILERHGGVCEMENTADGVRAVVRFLGDDLHSQHSE